MQAVPEVNYMQVFEQIEDDKNKVNKAIDDNKVEKAIYSLKKGSRVTLTSNGPSYGSHAVTERKDAAKTFQIIYGKTIEQALYEQTGMLPSQVASHQIQNTVEPSALMIDTNSRLFADKTDGKMFKGEEIDIEKEFGMTPEEEQEWGIETEVEEKEFEEPALEL